MAGILRRNTAPERTVRRIAHRMGLGVRLHRFVGVTEFHGDDDEDVAGGILGESKPPGPDSPRARLTLDVGDHMDPATRERLTLDKNGRIVHMLSHEARAAGIGLRVEA